MHPKLGPTNGQTAAAGNGGCTDRLWNGMNHECRQALFAEASSYWKDEAMMGGEKQLIVRDLFPLKGHPPVRLTGSQFIPPPGRSLSPRAPASGLHFGSPDPRLAERAIMAMNAIVKKAYLTERSVSEISINCLADIIRENCRGKEKISENFCPKPVSVRDVLQRACAGSVCSL